MTLKFREDYESEFNVKDYLSVWSDEAIKHCHPLSCDILTDLHLVFHKVEIMGERQLDFGCGPSLISVLSSSRQCSEVIMAEYAECNRNELTKWLKGDPKAHDWQPVMEYVANMEDNTTFKEMEKRVRSSILDVVPCDILKDDPIPSNPDFFGSFDLVTASLCLEAACPDIKSYEYAHKKLSRYLKKGGTLVLVGVLGNESYTVGTETFFDLTLNKENIDDALDQAGYEPATWHIHENDSAEADTSYCKIKNDPTGWFVLYAKKK